MSMIHIYTVVLYLPFDPSVITMTTMVKLNEGQLFFFFFQNKPTNQPTQSILDRLCQPQVLFTDQH